LGRLAVAGFFNHPYRAGARQLFSATPRSLWNELRRRVLLPAGFEPDGKLRYWFIFIFVAKLGELQALAGLGIAVGGGFIF
jgi:hypothetical protein